MSFHINSQKEKITEREFKTALSNAFTNSKDWGGRESTKNKQNIYEE